MDLCSKSILRSVSVHVSLASISSRDNLQDIQEDIDHVQIQNQAEMSVN